MFKNSLTGLLARTAVLVCSENGAFAGINDDLIEAVLNGDDQRVAIILASNDPQLDINHPGKWNALIAATCSGHVNIVQSLLADPTINVNATDSDGRTALSWAALLNKIRIVKTLCTIPGIDINHCADNGDGDTALMLAASSDNREVVRQLLITPGCDVNFASSDGFTALMSASVNGNGEVVRQLLEAGADMSLINESGETALMGAVRNGHSEVVKILENHAALLKLPTYEQNARNAIEGEARAEMRRIYQLKNMIDKTSNTDPAPEGSLLEQDPICPLCTEAFVVSDVVALFPCGHIYHDGMECLQGQRDYSDEDLKKLGYSEECAKAMAQKSGAACALCRKQTNAAAISTLRIGTTRPLTNQ